MSYHIKANTDITLLSANDILEICNPLFNNSNINYFDYFRAYNDGSRFWLCSSIKWIEYIYQQKYWQTNNFKISLNANFEPLLWQDVMRLMAKEDAKLYHDKIKDAYNYFNIKNGLAITDKQKNYTDYYNFGIAENDCSGYRINTGEIELLKKFIIYFREKANSFLREASKYKMQFSLDLYECDKKHKNHKYLLDINKIAFENQTAINRYYLSDHKKYLTKREISCLRLLAKGVHIKQIGHILALSTRSVEFYIRNIKSKLNLHRQSELISFIKNNEILNIS